jgi:bacillithiol system protein YtxJ
MADITRIETDDDLDRLWQTSLERPVWIFKHSLTCPISSAAWAEFRAYAADVSDDANVELAFLEIQRHRNLSTEIAQRTGVRHESPQAILLREESAVWNASHWAITKDALAAGEGEPVASGA